MDPVYYLPRTTCRNFECLSNLNGRNQAYKGSLFLFRCTKIGWNRYFLHQDHMCNDRVCPILAAWNDIEFY